RGGAAAKFDEQSELDMDNRGDDTDTQDINSEHIDAATPALLAPTDSFLNITVPQTIRVGTNCACRSCSTVVVMSLDSYCKRSLPAEWYPSWHSDSLKAG